MKHLTRLLDCDARGLDALLDRTAALRGGAAPADCRGRILGLVFETPSTRTRVSFEAAAMRLGSASTLSMRWLRSS